MGRNADMTQPPPRFWQDMTTREFAALDPAATVAVLPVAAIEQHGPHLPVSVDATINRGIVDRALELLPDHLPALFLPMMPLGLSPETAPFPGPMPLASAPVLRPGPDTGLPGSRTAPPH